MTSSDGTTGGLNVQEQYKVYST